MIALRSHHVGYFLLLLLGASLFLSTTSSQGVNLNSGSQQTGLPSVNAQSQTGEPIYTITKSDNTSLIFTVQLEGLQIYNQTNSTTIFQRIRIPGPTPTGQGLLGNLGLPELPTLTRFIAVPINSTHTVTVTDLTNPSTRSNILVYPIQIAHRNSAVKNDTEPPWQENTTFYSQYNALYPSTLYNQTGVERLRDVQVIALTLFPIQWTPYTRILTEHSRLQVTINFSGGVGYFKGTRLRAHEDAFNQIYNSTILNAAAVAQYTGPQIPFTQTGTACSEFLIITAPAFTTAADSLATWKISKGIPTYVVDTTTTGNTDTQIRSYLQGLYQNCNDPPSYVLLLGDVDTIPTHYYAECSDCPTQNAGDLYYAAIVGTDQLPDLSIGRMTVDTLTLAQTVVNKVINYEKTPPALASFYQNMVFASYFQDGGSGQDQRAFIQTSEAIRNIFKTTYTVQRIYIAPGWSTPMLYADGTALPAELLKPGFTWTGSTADISAAINKGAFLVFHRDHGWWNQWGSPSFFLSDVDALTNGNLLPVVFSINCASGIFDQKTVSVGYGANPNEVYFAERMLRKANGGAVAVIGDMRSSNTNANNDMSYGLFYSFLLQQIFGPVHAGNLLTFAKLWLQLRGWTGIEFLKEIEIYNLLGDPTLQIWTHQPPPNTTTLPTPLILTIILASSIATITLVRRRKP